MPEYSAVHKIGDPHLRFRTCDNCRHFLGNNSLVVLPKDCSKLADPKECIENKYCYREGM